MRVVLLSVSSTCVCARVCVLLVCVCARVSVSVRVRSNWTDCMLQPHRVRITKEETLKGMLTFLSYGGNNHQSVKHSIAAIFFAAFKGNNLDEARMRKISR